MFISSHYKCSFEKNFQLAVSELLDLARQKDHLVRIVFFGTPSDNLEFKFQQCCIASLLGEFFSNRIPAYTYLAQPLLNGACLGMEMQILEGCSDAVWKYSQYGPFHYLQVAVGETRMLFLPGITSSNLLDPVRKQSENIMKIISAILKEENFIVSDIVRQWNYIENITGMESSVKQRYQEFNDVRSSFYGDSFLKNGYPSATGIGTGHGGVQIELDALSDSMLYSRPIDNPKQRAAYDYSADVLVGTKTKTTPKFERARTVSLISGSWMYISGTAAIRGEETIDTNAREQALLALDNIRILLSDEVINDAGVPGRAELKSLRVYVKYATDFDSVKKAVEECYPNLEAIYVNAGICRNNLLVEMEGYALIVG